MNPNSISNIPLATDGELALLNHCSVLKRCWKVLENSFERTGIIESIIDEEQKRIQFLGDYSALDRLESLSSKILSIENPQYSHYLAVAQIDSARHHFLNAINHVNTARERGAPDEEVEPIELSIMQATGTDLPLVLKKRQDRAINIGGIANLLPLAALLSDMGEFDQARKTYLEAFQGYRDLSPFALAWVCFYLGMLHGEILPEPDLDEATKWYENAIFYIPDYVHARVHLSEIHLNRNQPKEAMQLLDPITHTGDPEVYWRYAQALEILNDKKESDHRLNLAKQSFNQLLSKHELGFADHAVEFYLETELDNDLALRLAKINLENRHTLGAFEATYNAAIQVNDLRYAERLTIQAKEMWSWCPAFQHSVFSEQNTMRASHE